MEKDTLTIDFETRSRINISRGLEYFTDSSTKVLCMAYKYNNGEVKIITQEDIMAVLLNNYLQMDINFISHNPNFEFGLIQNRLLKKYNLPDKTIIRFIPTELLSYFCGGPGKLGEAALYWGLKNIKDLTGKQLINILSIPFSDKTPKFFGKRKVEDMERDDYFIVDKELYKANEEYCKQDVQVTYDLYIKLKHILPEIHKHKLHFDYALNYIRRNKGITIDKQLVYMLIKELKFLESKYKKAGEKITKISDFNINSAKQVLNYLQKFDDTITATGKEYLTSYRAIKEDINPNVEKMIKLKAATPKSLSAKLSHLLCDTSYDGFAVCGTGQTRRFTGFGANFLNLPRTSDDVDLKVDLERLQSGLFLKHYKKDSYNQLKYLVRHVVIADNKFYGGDFSQIEFRLLMLCAGHLDILTKLFNGWDAYVYIAQKLFKKNKITPQERYICKRVTLARGYGLGVLRMATELAGEGIIVPLAELKALQAIYDNTFPKVKLFWNKQARLFNSSKGKKLKIPYSDRWMYFPRTRWFDGDWQIKTRKGYKKMWGGSLTGYVIQGLAADVFNYKIRELYKKHKINVVLPIHDEVVCEISNNNFTFEEFKRTMETTPDFLPKDKFPMLEGNYWQDRRYKKV